MLIIDTMGNINKPKEKIKTSHKSIIKRALLVALWYLSSRAFHILSFLKTKMGSYSHVVLQLAFSTISINVIACL